MENHEFDDDAGWLGVPATAERLGVPATRVYAAIDRGELPAYRFGRVIRLRVADVERYAGKH